MNKTALLTTLAATLLVSGTAFAGPKCPGSQPKMAQDKVKQMYSEMGYDIRKFKTSSGGCYEIYGIQLGKKVEVYIDPWTGAELQKQVD